jgi:hypothetical protein
MGSFTGSREEERVHGWLRDNGLAELEQQFSKQELDLRSVRYLRPSHCKVVLGLKGKMLERMAKAVRKLTAKN